MDKLKIKREICGIKRLGIGVVIKRETILIHPGSISIGNYTHIGERCYIRGGGQVIIGDNCQIGNNTIIVSSTHIIEKGKLFADNVINEDVIIGDNVMICSGAKILPGVTLGSNMVVGAGSVVTRSFLEGNCVIAGVPAKIIRNL
jgi:acetyltransferase-like isoleucine patch superfamily enzyme